MSSDTPRDAFGARTEIATPAGPIIIHRLGRLEELGLLTLARLPYSIRILLEAVLRHEDGATIDSAAVEGLARYDPTRPQGIEVPFRPARVLLQDFTGVPCLVDLAAMRSAMKRLGGDPAMINPRIPVDLVIDHSVQVESFACPEALRENARIEFARNRERYEFLRWGQEAFNNLRVVPPASGICHQVNLEYLARVVQLEPRAARSAPTAYPDTLVGTDSHTPMVNGIGVLGWGVGGIEAEAALLGQPLFMPAPAVVGVRLTGALRPGATATDLVLTVTERLRRIGVVGKFVEFFGPGLASLSVPDRATVANMAPEYGATVGFFPVDEQTFAYLRASGRSLEQVELAHAYCRAQHLLRTPECEEPDYEQTVTLELEAVERCVAGPKRPQDRVPLTQLPARWHAALAASPREGGFGVPAERQAERIAIERAELEAFQPCARTHDAPAPGALSHRDDREAPPPPRAKAEGLAESAVPLGHGAVVIAAITSCTNTSNPSVMLGAGLLARRAVEAGLRPRPWVKTSLAPGSKVVTDYLARAGLTPYLEQLGFHVVGYGCTTCIGNSGPLPPPVATAVRSGELVAAAVLSGNRNFEGRINPDAQAAYLMSPMLVIAFALAGTIDIDLTREPLGQGRDGRPVFLADLWPSTEEIEAFVESSVNAEMFAHEYGRILQGDADWQAIAVTRAPLYRWRAESTYILEPPFFQQMSAARPPLRQRIEGARLLVWCGDSVTTDHISPAGAIPAASPAGQHLIARGVAPDDFNSYGSRRGNHDVMTRGTFANIRFQNLLTPDRQGGWTRHHPSGEVVPIFTAAERYRDAGTPTLVIGGRDYGMGSSRDWASKGTQLLGVAAVLAESFERIHRSNLVGMGVLPLQFRPGESATSLRLTGDEVFRLELPDPLAPQAPVKLEFSRQSLDWQSVEVIARFDAPIEIDYYRQGGILPAVLRGFLQQEAE